jgi:phosphomannomutase
MERLRREPPDRLHGRRVVEVVDHLRRPAPVGPADLVVLELEDRAWAAVRPSGTEPKLKVYAELVQPVERHDLVAAKAQARADLERLRGELERRLGFPDAGSGLG